MNPSTFVPTELVVDLADRGLVEAELRRRSVCHDPDRAESNDVLGLTLLRELEGMGDLDELLASLRDHFEQRYDGWSPVLGKNRHVTGPSIVSSPEVAVAAGTGPAMIDLRPRIEFYADASGGHFTVCGPGSGKVMGSGSGTVTGPGSGKVMVVMAGHWWSTSSFAIAAPAYYSEAGVAVSPDGTPLPVTAVGVVATAVEAPAVASRIARYAPDAEIDVRAITPGDPGGVTAWELATAIAGFVRDDGGAGIDVLHVALGCRTLDGKPPLVLTRAVERLGRSVAVVAAAETTAPAWPAALPDVVAVGLKDSPWVTVPADAEDGGLQSAAADVSGRLAARTTPGVKSARQALEELRAGDSGMAGGYR